MNSEQVWLLLAIGLLSFVLSFIGAAVGLVLGHMRLPLLVGYFGSPITGAACNLMVSSVGALAGSIRHIRDRRISWNCLALMGLPSIFGAMIAAYVFNRHINHLWAYLVIGVMLIISGVNLAWPGKKDEAGAEMPRGRLILFEIIIGLALGALAAVTGLMLGSLRLPMMMRFLKLDPREAVGSNMVIGCATGLVGAITSLASATSVDWPALLRVFAIIAPPTILGGWLGGWLTGRISKDAVKMLAGWIIGLTGVLMLGQGVLPFTREEKPEVTILTDDEPDELDDLDADDD